MPTVEDYFDDETDLPLPSSSKPRKLTGQGTRGALLEEISDDDGEGDMDFGKLAEQSRGIFGEGAQAPPPHTSTGKGKVAVRDSDTELRPAGGPGMPGGPGFNPNTPMGGFMGDMMKLQQAEDERMEKMRRQFQGSSMMDPSVYKG